MTQNKMAKQTISVLIIVLLVIFGATIQSAYIEGRNIELTIYPDTGIQVEYYPNGFPKYAIETVKPGIVRTTEWYPDGLIKTRSCWSNACSHPFYIEEWYVDGVKKKEEFYRDDSCKIDSNFYGLLDKHGFGLHVFSSYSYHPLVTAIPPDYVDSSIFVIGVLNLPLRSWHSNGRLKNVCNHINEKGVEYVSYSESGDLEEKSILYRGLIRADL